MLDLAHGVGRLYESPIPLSYYLAGAALTVLASFFIRAFAATPRPHRWRPVERGRIAGAIAGVVRGYMVTVFGLVLVFSIIYSDETGYGIPALTFWVCLIIIPVALCSIFSGLWPAASPWATIEGLYRLDEDAHEQQEKDAPAWLPPLLIYAFFWFELVSGRGFDPPTILVVIGVYTLYVLVLAPKQPLRRDQADPLGILFGFAQRIAPLEIREGRLFYRGFVADLDAPGPMPLGLFAALFILLASTTLDNVRETVQWFDFLQATGLDQIHDKVVDSLGLVALTIPFLVPFLLCVALARVWAEQPASWLVTARLFAWSLIPIGIAYVLAHNMPLLVIGLPQLIQQIAESFGSGLFRDYNPSPLLVWVLEIALIVGGHVIGVLVAHRAAVRVAGSHAAALKSHIALTLLMSLFTITTLWMLSLPLVTT